MWIHNYNYNFTCHFLNLNFPAPIFFVCRPLSDFSGSRLVVMSYVEVSSLCVEVKSEVARLRLVGAQVVLDVPVYCDTCLVIREFLSKSQSVLLCRAFSSSSRPNSQWSSVVLVFNAQFDLISCHYNVKLHQPINMYLPPYLPGRSGKPEYRCCRCCWP